MIEDRIQKIEARLKNPTNPGGGQSGALEIADGVEGGSRHAGQESRRRCPEHREIHGCFDA